MSSLYGLGYVDVLERLFSFASVIAAIASAAIGAITFVYTVRSARTDPTKSEGSIGEEVVTKGDSGNRRPFEVAALAGYYNQALKRANVSFWFSIAFASIGFGVLIFSFLSYSPSDITGTVLKVLSGTIIDAVAGLFFVQSTNAQRSMGDFFEKLRLDRLNVEARDMISEIENAQLRDELRSQLILKYSGIDRLLTGRPPT